MSNFSIWISAAWQPETGITTIGYVRLNEDTGNLHRQWTVAGINKTVQRAQLYAAIYALHSLKKKLGKKHKVTIFTTIEIWNSGKDSNIRRDNADLWDDYYDLRDDFNEVEIQQIKRESHPNEILAHFLTKRELRKVLRRT